MLRKKELIKEIKESAIYFDSKYNLNCGGCCYFAAKVAQILEYFNISYSTIIFEYFKDKDVTKQDVINLINNRKFNIVLSSRHYAIKVGNTYINLGIFIGEENLVFDSSIVNYKDLAWIYKKAEWNNYYSRYHNSEISKFFNKLKIKYEKISKENN